MRISDWSSDVCSSDLFDGELRPIKDPRRVEMSDRAGIDSYRPGDSYLFEIAGLGGSGAISLLSAPVDVPPVTRAIEVPGATETLTFTLTEARKLSFDSLTDDSRIRWTLIGPKGTIVDGDRKRT